MMVCCPEADSLNRFALLSYEIDAVNQEPFQPLNGIWEELIGWKNI